MSTLNYVNKPVMLPFEPNSVSRRGVIRGASHQPHSAWQARPRRDRQEHAEYYYNTLNTLNYATSCRTLTRSSAAAG